MWQDYQATRNGRAHSVIGNVKVLQDLESAELGNRRDILVYLPPSYESGNNEYPVCFLHDGQNLFDEATSFAGEWRVDNTMETLSQEGVEAIMVGIPNSAEERLDEYSPFHSSKLGGGRGDLYLQFLINQVKPLIDAEFRTLPDPADTGIMGSSMGGLISLYAFFHHPEAFGFAGVMSPSLWFANGAIYDFVRKAPFNAGRLYMDAGTREYGGDSTWSSRPFHSRRYYAGVRRMYRLLVKKGYRPRRDLLYVEEKRANHDEEAWARRLPAAIRFLLDRTSEKRETAK
ncbi:MAG TPA: alpha/beta hydrolase-fold protein [Anaerolineae bacterium]|jgi:predicted alpha/beta superfamily hydrolase|nr:alpha/beta hydrolase-fold protein [Anaerolineae bacterium]